MCGIAGIYRLDADSTAADRADLTAMTAALAHRGPDGEDFFQEGPLVLGHRRLSIIDRGGGAQPMLSASQRQVISYNGEIYNYLRLRRLFSGHEWRSRSDTELLLEGLERDGLAFLPRVNGMFAFACYDRLRRSLTLARDAVGEKPLHYCLDGTRLLFASELKGILAALPGPPAVDEDALAEYLRYGYVASPRTIFAGIRKLPPGFALQLESGTLRQTAWCPKPDSRPPASEEEFRELLRDAVSLRRISDVPLGAFLSGGIDSSAVVAMMSHGDGPVRSFAAGFREAAYDESVHAARVARHFSTEHECLTVESQSLNQFEDIVRWLDEPLADPSLLPTWQICRLARTRVSVVLSGDGADELFGGYERYRFARLAGRFSSPAGRALLGLVRRISPLVRPLVGQRGLRLEKFLRFCLERELPYLGSVEYFDPQTIRRVGTGNPDAALPYAALAASARGDAALAAILAADFRYYLAEDILVKLDRASMAVSLEARVPFLDPRIVALAHSLPVRERVDGTRLKVYLRRALAPVLPPTVLQRAKQGFALPLAEWYAGTPGRIVEERLTASGSPIADWFDRGEIRRRFREQRSGEGSFAFSLHNLNILDLWARNWCYRRRN